MPQTLDEFRVKFRVDELELRRNAGWTSSLRPAACTLGACVFSANRPHTSLATLDRQEAADLVELVAWFEGAARARFAAEKFNYLALMMVDDHLHFHALPRYAAERNVGDATFRDAAWPGPPDLKGENPDRLAEVRAMLLGGEVA